MTNKFKTLLKTTAAVASLFAGAQTWGSAIKIAALDAAGDLIGSKAYHGTVAADEGAALVAPEKSVVVLEGAALTMASGGIVATGSTFTFDVSATGWTILDVVATKDLNLFVRAHTEGTAIAAFTIANLILADKAGLVKIWKSDVTSLTVTAALYEAKPGRLSDGLVETDVASPAPTMDVGGRTYTLDTIVSIR